MLNISKEQVLSRVRFENPWWTSPHRIAPHFQGMKRSAYFPMFARLVEEVRLERAMVLMGPRRVGKTVLMHDMTQKIVDEGVKPRRICYFSVEQPIYIGLGLDELFAHAREAVGASQTTSFYVFFGEIHY